MPFSPAKSHDRISTITFPTRVLTLSLLLTALTLGWLVYCAVSTYISMAATSVRYARSSDLRGIVVHLDEVLTMSANMAAAAGDAKWEKRYRANEGKLDAAIKATMKDAPLSALQTKHLDEANLSLVAMENRAFDEVRRGNPKRARAILESPQYGQQKQIYARAISNYLASAHHEQQIALEAPKRQGIWVLLAGLIGLLGLSLSWVVAARELSRWRDANAAEIEARRVANLQLEAQRAQLQASQARYERMATNVPGMVYQFVLKPDGTIEMPFVSDGAREIYGIEPAAIRADSNLALGAVIAADRPSLDESIAQSARDLTPWQWDGRMEMADGTRKWINGIARPARLDNGDISWDGVLLDITPRKNHEAALDRARREAEAANNAKSEFLGRMSHELRTPLNAILGFGQLLEIEDLTADQAQSVEQIMVAGHHLLALISEVLDIARIESGQQELQLERVDAAKLAREVCDLVRPLAQKNHIALDICFGGDCCGPVDMASRSVLADPQRVKQILLNLLSNAVKYAGVGATIRLGCQQIAASAQFPAESPKLALTVSDNGPGIASELQERVWVPFDRIGAETTETEGAGVGLPLARELAKAMGGSLELQSAPGQGATFVLALPYALPNAESCAELRAESCAPSCANSDVAEMVA